jgi:hypothetical protein
MSTLDSKTEQHRTTDGPARRTYSSLFGGRGFQLTHGGQRGTGVVVSIEVMQGRSLWRHVDGTGKWNAATALYEEVTP